MASAKLLQKLCGKMILSQLSRSLPQLPQIPLSLRFGGLFLGRNRILDVNRLGVCLKKDLVVVNGRTDKTAWLVCAIVERVQGVQREQRACPLDHSPLFLSLLTDPQEVRVSHNDIKDLRGRMAMDWDTLTREQIHLVKTDGVSGILARSLPSQSNIADLLCPALLEPKLLHAIAGSDHLEDFRAAR
jgi:hypothetical protein